MSSSEQALYTNLQEHLGDSYIILSKVRIEDFVEVKKYSLDNNKWWGLRSKIKSRHVDFLICDKITTKPLLAIELDDISHRRADRRRRDCFINDLYKQIGLSVEHIPVGSDFSKEVLRIKNMGKSGI